MEKEFNTTTLSFKLIPDEFLQDGKIKEDLKFNFTNPKFKIQNSKFLGNPDDKFETMLFLPEGVGRKGEGGLRTKGYFKFSYENLILNDECLIMDYEKSNPKSKIQNSKSKIQNSKSNTQKKWYMLDLNGNPIQPAPDNIQNEINAFISNSILNTPNPTFNIQNSTFDKLPLITVITVVYNGAKTLEQTIQSVINQSYPNIEYIIIDGGSTDGTLDIIKKYEDYIDYWVSEKDEGIYDAMNKGVSVSFGSWLFFLGSDDLIIFKETFTEIFFETLFNADFIYGKVLIKEKSEMYDGKFSSYKLCIKNICHQSIFYNIKHFKKSGLYNQKYKILADYEFNMRIWNNSKKIYVDKVVSIYSIKGISGNNKDENFMDDYFGLIKLYFGNFFFVIVKIRKFIIYLLDILGLKNTIKKF